MKKTLALLIALAIMLTFAACTSGTASPTSPPAETAPADNAPAAEPTAEPAPTTAPDPVELNVSAAASLTDVMSLIADEYKAEHPEVTLTFNFGSSGALQTQIEEGAPADLFLSAGQKQMTALQDAGLIVDDTRTDLLINKVVLIVPQNSALGITTFEDAAEKSNVFAIGDPASVPAGQYAEEVYTSLGLWDTITAKATLGTDVRAVLNWVESGDADAGIVYATDAATTPNVTVVAEAPEGSHTPIVYPGAVIAASEHQEAAKAFLDFLKTGAATALFESAGFSPAG
jgi:molybdate transport system substrate-binding protein